MALDPQMQAILDDMPRPGGVGAPDDGSLTEMRAGVHAMTLALSPPTVETVDVAELTIPGPNGDIRCLVNRPQSDEKLLPIFVYYHGGGCVLCDADCFNPTCTQIADQAQCIVVNVDYRLAPEHPFPEPLDDATAAYFWVLEHADELGGDPQRVAIGGDSAGGYLATTTCLEAKAHGVAQPVQQILIYPSVDLADRSESMITIDAFINEPMLTALSTLHAAGHFLDPRASPLRATDHSGLAPAFILAAGVDPMRDQAVAYAAVLRRAAVPVDYVLYEDAMHIFFTMGGAVDRANEAVSEVAAQLRKAFTREPKPSRAI